MKFNTTKSQSKLANVTAYVRQHPNATEGMIARRFGMTTRSAQYYLRALRDMKPTE